MIKVKNENELAKIIKPVKEKKLKDELGQSAYDKLVTIERKLAKLEKTVRRIESITDKAYAKAVLNEHVMFAMQEAYKEKLGEDLIERR